jgi:undecaprenyl-diphosphatase
VNGARRSLAALALASAAGFAALGAVVATSSHVSGEVTAERDLHRALASSATDTLMKVVSFLGAPAFLLPLSVVVAVVLVYVRRRDAALFLLASVAGAYLLEESAKAAWHRARPDLWPSLAHARGYAFPSGHAAGSMAFALALIILAWRTPARWIGLAAGLAFTAAVGLSRVYLGVHYPTDVGAGWLLAAAWVATFAFLAARAGRRL